MEISAFSIDQAIDQAIDQVDHLKGSCSPPKSSLLMWKVFTGFCSRLAQVQWVVSIFIIRWDQSYDIELARSYRDKIYASMHALAIAKY